jgi:hypothetical protein
MILVKKLSFSHASLALHQDFRAPEAVVAAVPEWVLQRERVAFQAPGRERLELGRPAPASNLVQAMVQAYFVVTQVQRAQFAAGFPSSSRRQASRKPS